MNEIDRLRKNVFNNLQKIEEQEQEITRLNNIIDELEKLIIQTQDTQLLQDFKRIKGK